LRNTQRGSHHDILEENIFTDSVCNYDINCDVVYRNGIGYRNYNCASIILLVFPEPYHPVAVVFKTLRSALYVR